MPLLKYITILGQLDHHIRSKRTGSPGQFAAIMNISERMLYIYLGDMRKIGASLKYDQINKTYVYESDFDLQNAIEDLIRK